MATPTPRRPLIAGDMVIRRRELAPDILVIRTFPIAFVSEGHVGIRQTLDSYIYLTVEQFYKNWILVSED